MSNTDADTRDGIEELENVIKRYKSTVYGIALTRLKNRADAEDVFQEVFLTYWRKAPSFNGEEHRKAWLINTAINCSKKLYGKNRRFALGIDESEPVYEFSDRDDTALYSAIMSLEEKYRTVIYLHYFEDMTAENIGKALGIRAGTVRMQLTRARNILKEKLGGEYFE